MKKLNRERMARLLTSELYEISDEMGLNDYLGADERVDIIVDTYLLLKEGKEPGVKSIIDALKSDAEEYFYDMDELDDEAEMLKNRIEVVVDDLKELIRRNPFTRVTPVYTGGGIYIFYGETEEGEYFIADDNWCVRILNEDPETDEESDYEEWQEAHLVRDLGEDEAKAFFADMLRWVIENKPSSRNCNYDMYDIECMLNDYFS